MEKKVKQNQEQLARGPVCRLHIRRHALFRDGFVCGKRGGTGKETLGCR